MSVRPVTLADIARHLGVTTATVSMALRNNPSISQKTRQQVAETAQKLSYKPDPRFSALMEFLRSRRKPPFHSTIAHLHDFPTPDGHLATRTHSEFFHGASEQAKQLGFSLEPIWAKEKGFTARRLEKILKARGIPGILMTSPKASLFPIREPLDGFAVGVIGYTNWEPLYCRACNNQSHSMTLAIKRLSALGYTRIALVLSSQDDLDTEHNWLSAYLAFQFTIPQTKRLPPLLGPEDEIFSPSKLKKWIEKYRPDCILGHTNPLLDRLWEIGFHIPDEMGFASLDWFERPDRILVSGIEQNSRFVGAAAMQIAAGQVSLPQTGQQPNPHLVLIESSWIEGQTTRPQHTLTNSRLSIRAASKKNSLNRNCLNFHRSTPFTDILLINQNIVFPTRKPLQRPA